MTIHKEGKKILLGSLLTFTIILIAVHFFLPDWKWLFYFLLAAFIVLYILFLQFFRLPQRTNNAGADQLVAPCDGKVVVIEEVEEPEYFHDRRIQISIFMSPLNVHANWTVCEGDVRYVKYHKGLYLVAWHPKSSTENERTTVVVERKQGQAVLMRQIAGAVARRIVYYVNTGDRLERNHQFGFIKFGSRVDIFLPVGTKVHVKIGDVTIGNETILAEWQS
ncbi:MAG: phosphatidylserine decarboxylase family protein [Crocinitomicaceae bacterium]|nr:phosphatidylserine decarboxylase family protein [Crocinitomicaceae bacterium]